jgi:hypothetical protein
MVRLPDAPPLWARAVAAWDDVEALVKQGSAWREANKNDEEGLAAADRVGNEGVQERADALVSLVRALSLAGPATDPARKDSKMDDATAKAFMQRATDAWSPKARISGVRGVQARGVLGELATAELRWLVDKGATIDAAHWTDAESAVVRTRDDPDDDERKVGGASLLVTLRDLRVRYDEKRWKATNGREGLRPRDRSLKSPVALRTKEAVPSSVEEAVKARDGLADASKDRRGAAALKEAAGIMLAYGRGDEAGKRLAGALALECKGGGFETFVLAAQVAKATKNGDELKRLAALNEDPEKTCAKGPDEVKRGRDATK